MDRHSPRILETIKDVAETRNSAKLVGSVVLKFVLTPKKAVVGVLFLYGFYTFEFY